MSIKKTGLSAVDYLTTCRYSDGFQYSLAALPLQAKRVLFLILAQISNPKDKPKENELSFSITAKEFSIHCKLRIDATYNELEEAVRVLAKSAIYEDVSVDRLRRLDETNIVSKVTYHIDEGYCTIKINKDAYPYFFELSKAFTTNNIYEFVRLTEKNAMNLHQVIMKRYSKSNINYDYKTSFVIGIEELKDEMWLFNTDGRKKEYRYTVFAELNKLLKKTAKEIQKSTSLKNISIEIYKKIGRKATHLKISYQHINDIRRQEEKKLNQEPNHRCSFLLSPTVKIP